MPSSDNKSSFLLNNWLRKADQWIGMLNDSPIPVFKKYNDEGLLDKIKELNIKSVLFLGSADGAIVEQCTRLGIYALGLDIYEEFISFSIKEREGDYRLIKPNASFASVISSKESFELIVFAFGYFTDSTMEHWLKDLTTVANKNTIVLVQAMHPTIQAISERPYKSGWQPGNWMDGKDNGTDSPFPWFFRTLEDWSQLFIMSNLSIEKISEPKGNTDSSKPLSLLFELRRNKN